MKKIFVLLATAWLGLCPAGQVSAETLDTPVPTNTANAQRDDVPCTKVFRDGMLLIDRNGRTYTVTGAELR